MNIKQTLIGLKNKLGKALLVGGAAVATTVMARADDGFNAHAVTADFSTAAQTAATVVASIAALSCGIAVYKKVKGYFTKA